MSINENALQFGLIVQSIVKERNLKPVRIRVVYNNDIVFQYMMEGKTSDEWLNRKQKTVMETGKASLYVFEHQEDYPDITMENGYAVCGGGVPMIIDDEVVGCYIVSGLAHEEDHGLIIEALERMDKE